MRNLMSPEGGKDTIYLDRDGVRTGPLKCNFSSPETILFYKVLDVTEGDKLVRETPVREDLYTITEVNYSHGLGSIPPHYRLTIVKDSAIKPKPQAVPSNTYHIHNSHGIQIGDNNVQNFELFVRDMVASIDQSDATLEERNEAKGKLRAFLEHPLVSAGFGAALPAIIGLLG